MEINHTANIKRIAKDKGIQLYELAEKLEITKETLSRLINGTNPTISTIEKFARVLNVEPSEILFGIKDKPFEPGNHVCPHCGKKINICISLEE